MNNDNRIKNIRAGAEDNSRIEKECSQVGMKLVD